MFDPRAALAVLVGCAPLALLVPDDEEPAPADPESTLPTAGADDVAHVPALDLFAEDDEKKRCVLIGWDEEADAPEKGYGLIVILPGGDGSIDFHAFCKRIHDHAVPEGFLTLQLVSPAWTEWSAENLVWPTAANTMDEARFPTEEHLADAVAAVRERVKIDPKRVFGFAWSSGGPALYASSLTRKTPLVGSLVAMSVFVPDHLPDLRRAKGHRYYLLHSPEDFVPIAHAERARTELAAHRATTTLVTYEGGHGWRGDVFGEMRKGFAWIAEGWKEERGR